MRSLSLRLQQLSRSILTPTHQRLSGRLKTGIADCGWLGQYMRGLGVRYHLALAGGRGVNYFLCVKDRIYPAAKSSCVHE